MDFLQSMAWPFLACLVLTGIHVYLGIHVISRKVIFVDLALAQIAAFGAVWGALLGWDLHEDTLQIKGFSLGLTILAAAVFALTRMREERVPQEAIIGISYAVALAATILASAQLAHGSEEVQGLLAGSVLWVGGETVGLTAALYTAVGLFHYVFRRRFLTISMDHALAEAQGVRVRLWDFFFYASFGFVVTSSVSIAGVLLVFSYLVIPAVVGVLFASSVGGRLAIGWTTGTLVSLGGVSISYWRDLPSGPTIVVCFGVFLVVAAGLHHWWNAPARGRAALQVLGGLAVLVLLGWSSRFLRKHEEQDVAHVLESGSRAERVLALARVAAEPELFEEIRPLVPDLLREASVEVRLDLLELVARRGAGDLLPSVLPLLRDPDDVVRERAVDAVVQLDRPEAAPEVVAAAGAEEDPYIRVEMAEAAIEFGADEGMLLLLQVMEEAEAHQARREAHEHLRAHLPPVDLSYAAEADGPTRSEQVEALRSWWEEAGRPVLPHPSSSQDDA